MPANRVQVIQDWPKPCKIKDIQSFLGFTNFYWCFILKYSNITVPLTHLTHKGTTWDFSDKCCSTFNTLKKAFTTVLILAHWIPGSLLSIETDASDYALTAILSTISLMDNEVHPIAFHSHTFTLPELNCNVCDKEWLAIFEAFKIWQHYLKGSPTPIDVAMDHENLEYFPTTKLLTCCQICWSEFLCQFNLIICFHPRHLGTKPDALTRQWDVYSKEGGSDYASINPTNLQPMFMQEQLTSSLHTTFISIPALHTATIMDIEKLHSNIHSSLHSDLIAYSQLDSHPHIGLLTPKGFLLLDEKIYIPDISDL